MTRKSSRKLCCEQNAQNQKYAKKSYFIGMTVAKSLEKKTDETKVPSMEIDATPEAGIQAVTFICKLKGKTEKGKVKD